MSKDYYKILGVNEFDCAENIKSAYRKLARKWHPDIAGNNETVLSKFKEINEAYEILSNSVKKEEYDRARRFYSYAQGNPGSEKNSENSDRNKESYAKNDSDKEKQTTDFNIKEFSKMYFKWEETILKKFRNGTPDKHDNYAPVKGKDVYTEIEINFMESVRGTEKIINVLQTGMCPKCKGKKFINGSICSCCGGKGEYTEHKKFTVKIPAGIKNKSKIRLAGEGNKGEHGGVNGDLYIIISVKEPDNCRTEGLNIYKTVPVTPYEAVLGANIDITSITGKYTVTIAPNTQSGQKIRLSGCGIVQNEQVGDMIITVEIRIPKNLTETEISLYKKLSEISEGISRDSIYDR